MCVSGEEHVEGCVGEAAEYPGLVAHAGSLAICWEMTPAHHDGEQPQGGYLAVDERHAAGPSSQAVGKQVQPALDQARRELCFAVLPVGERPDFGRGDDDERDSAGRTTSSSAPTR